MKWFIRIIYTIFVIILSIIGLVYGCKSNKTKEPVIVQSKCVRGCYNHIFYRRISNWQYGKIDVGDWDYNHISEGDTIYLNF